MDPEPARGESRGVVDDDRRLAEGVDPSADGVDGALGGGAGPHDLDEFGDRHRIEEVHANES